MSKILVVDDSEFSQLVLETHLKSWGFEVCTCNDAPAALVLLEKEKFDLILLDLIMPQMDGLEFLAHKREKNYFTPVIIISSVTEKDMVEKAKVFGSIDFIAKPYSSAILKGKISKIFRDTEG